MEVLDKTDLMLLQHPEMWGNDYPNAYKDIVTWGKESSHSETCPIKVGCPECIAESKIECIAAIKKSMEASEKYYNEQNANGEMNAIKWKKYNDEKHRQLIEILVLEGKHPEPKKKKPVFRNGLYEQR